MKTEPEGEFAQAGQLSDGTPVAYGRSQSGSCYFAWRPKEGERLAGVRFVFKRLIVGPSARPHIGLVEHGAARLVAGRHLYPVDSLPDGGIIDLPAAHVASRGDHLFAMVNDVQGALVDLDEIQLQIDRGELN